MGCGLAVTDLDPDDEEGENRLVELRTVAPNPMLPLANLSIMCFSNPIKAPLKMKRMLSVLTLYISPLAGEGELGGLVFE